MGEGKRSKLIYTDMRKEGSSELVADVAQKLQFFSFILIAMAIAG